MKAIFLRGLEANVDHPRKLRVEVRSELKNRFVESVEGLPTEVAKSRGRAKARALNDLAMLVRVPDLRAWASVV